eukprot:2091320-Rhodomonas_salina.1
MKGICLVRPRERRWRRVLVNAIRSRDMAFASNSLLVVQQKESSPSLRRRGVWSSACSNTFLNCSEVTILATALVEMQRQGQNEGRIGLQAFDVEYT